jgi:tripartite-type tricarboxylate transporter receptor subunit TctC
MRSTWKWLTGAVLVALSLQSAAQTYPGKPVRLIVPYPAGGTVDTVARVVAQGMSEQTGQPWIVENKAGANGVVGSDYVARSAPDGYTLLLQASIFVINPLFLTNVPYNVEKDFAPISNIGSVPLLVTGSPSNPARDLREFVSLVKQAPEKYTFATSGLGSAGHLSEEVIKKQAELPGLMIVPYKGAAPALADMLGGHVSAMIDPFPSSYPNVKSGKLTPLAVTSGKRVAFLPNVPTVAESGFPGFEMVSWYGLWGPAGLPADVVGKLSTAAAKAVRSSHASERLAAQGFDPVGSTPAEFATYIKGEIARYAVIVKEANIKGE